MRRVILSFISLFILVAHSAAQIPDNQYCVDHPKKLVVCNANVNLVSQQLASQNELFRFDAEYRWIDDEKLVGIGIPYKILNTTNDEKYTLFFTRLPIVTITTEHTIQDTPKVPANFRLVETDQNEVVSPIGIEYRGGWSQTLPKKSLEIEFWQDGTGNETLEYSLLGMTAKDDWNLQAMYNEPMRIRSKTNNELWRKIHTIYYQESEPDAVNGIGMEYAELFLNGDYQGVYCIGEKVKRKQLKLKKYNGNIRGELYKGIGWGASTFTSLPAMVYNTDLWGGFELKYPDEVLDWSPIYAFVDFVVNSPDEDFYAQYRSKFHLGNAVDYFIFLNLLRATDNAGKNVYIAKYNTGDPYFYVPWDLDGTFGTIWTGLRENITDDLLTNGFYLRLLNDYSPDGFKERLTNRWNELRQDIITHENIMGMFSSNLDILIENGIYEREHMAWTDYNFDLDHLDYLSQWTTNRLNYLDGAFGLTQGPTQTPESGTRPLLAAIVFPNPASDKLSIVMPQGETGHATLYNAFGQAMVVQELKEISNDIDLLHIANGIYVLEIIKSSGRQTTKIIVRK
ncbi:MAG: CotH kinase family protein [Breznakibacter sp.]